MTETSVFYKGRFERTFNIPMLAFEMLGIEFANAEEITDELASEIYKKVLEQGCSVKYTEVAITELVTRMQEAIPAQGKEKPSGGSKKRGFASGFYKYIGEIRTDHLLLQVCNYDVEAARELYCVADRADVMEVVETYIARTQHDHSVMLEACVYGFGGDVEGSSDSVTEFNLADDPKAAAAAMKGIF